MTGLFSGDRFIPYRPEETHLDGCDQFLHEENLMNNNLLRVPRRHHRGDDASMSSDSNSRRSHSTPSSGNSSNNSSSNSNRSHSERVNRHSRRRQMAYENLLNTHCFQDPESMSLHNLSHIDNNGYPEHTVAPHTRDQAKPIEKNQPILKR